jgi:hypothetical protein
MLLRTLEVAARSSIGVKSNYRQPIAVEQAKKQEQEVAVLTILV